MSVIIYACDTCKRSVEIVENDKALSLVDNCVITQNCKGSLYKTGRRANGVIGKPTPVVEGLDDYEKRGRLFIHEQTTPASSWPISHNLNTNPLLYVYLKAVNNTYTQLEADDYVVRIIDHNNITIEFADNNIGIVHIVARANVEQPQIESVQAETIQVTANTIFTIATPVFSNDDSVIQNYNIRFTSPTTTQQTVVSVPFTAHKRGDVLALFTTPWRQVQLITWNNKLYRVRSVRVDNIINANKIENGSPFYFVDSPELIMLSSNSPFVDITDVSNKVVYAPDINQNNTRNRLVGSELVIESTSFIDTFPHLRVYKTIFQ